MGIDLEQPSGEYHNEDSRHQGNVDVVEQVDKGDSANRPRSFKVVENDKGNVGPKINAELRRNRAYNGQGINLNSPKLSVPHDGMEFDSKEEAFSYYKEYAKSVGFAALIKASRRSRLSGKFIDAKFACTRYGNRRESGAAETPESHANPDNISNMPVKRKRGRVNLSWAKTDCKACMHVKRRQDGRWIICSFIKEHNHEIFPDQAYYCREHRNLDLGINTSDALHAMDRTKKMFGAMSRKSGGYKKVENKKGSNGKQLGDGHHLALDEGDVQAMLDHFIDMQDENPNFFYAIDLNEGQQLRSVFWVDAKSRLDYRHFNDVVLFDTIHIKNEYKLPFIPFIGVNHHSQFLLLGLALVSDESKLTYMWLLRAWFRAMGGRAPNVILTDQEEALKEAVAEVLPESRHCFCLWHMLSKIPEKLSHVTLQHANFMTKFNKCVVKSWTSEQFEKRWWKMVEKFNLGDDNLLSSIYEDRERWIPTYMRGTFLAGMSTMQRPETISCLLDKYLLRKTPLKEFLEQYKVILRDKYEEEAKADFETLHKKPALKSPSPFGKQMSTLYTHAIFKKFQSEVLGVVACHPRKESEDGTTKIFKVQDFEDSQEFTVMWDETTCDASCSCRSFEFNGFLCRHVMIVLQISGVHNIPSQYILKRWTKDAKNRQTSRELSDVVESRIKRYDDLCQRAFELSDEGSLTQECYVVAVNALEEALRKCECLNDSIQSVIEPSLPIFGSQEVNLSNTAGHTSRYNCTFKEGQVYPGTDNIARGIDSSWLQMENPSTCTAGLDCSYKSQQSIQEMLNSRGQNLDGYFATQQIVSGMVICRFQFLVMKLILKVDIQLQSTCWPKISWLSSIPLQGQVNSIAASRNDYCSNQYCIEGLGQLNSTAPIHDTHYIALHRMHVMDQPNGGPTQLHKMG